MSKNPYEYYHERFRNLSPEEEAKFREAEIKWLREQVEASVNWYRGKPEFERKKRKFYRGETNIKVLVPTRFIRAAWQDGIWGHLPYENISQGGFVTSYRCWVRRNNFDLWSWKELPTKRA